MPELPEVETVMRGMRPALEGHTIVKAEVRRAGLRQPFPKNFAQRLTGRQVLALRRRAKYILAALDGGESLVLHLGMSGRITIHHAPDIPPPGKHDHVLLHTDADSIIFTDPRRFGLMTLVADSALTTHPLFAGLGPEPLAADFTPSVLKTALANRHTPIKSALLDQRIIAGLGNIYVCEALFAAGISPTREACSVNNIKSLHRSIQVVLQAAIASGGSTLRDYRHADGSLGYFQHRFKVYGREGQPCPRRSCNGTILKITQAGRSSYFCPKCQK